jgi:hypothetical protein
MVTDISGKPISPILKGQAFCPETSVTTCHSTLRNIPEERRPNLHGGRNLNSRMTFSLCCLGRGHTILTSRELMWYYARSWDVRGGLTLNSVTRIHFSVTLLTSRGALVGSRASTPHTFLLSHTFREAWPTCRVLCTVTEWQKSESAS